MAKPIFIIHLAYSGTINGASDYADGLVKMLSDYHVIVELLGAFLAISIPSEVLFYRFKDPKVNEMQFTDKWLRLFAYTTITIIYALYYLLLQSIKF